MTLQRQKSHNLDITITRWPISFQSLLKALRLEERPKRYGIPCTTLSRVTLWWWWGVFSSSKSLRLALVCLQGSQVWFLAPSTINCSKVYHKFFIVLQSNYYHQKYITICHKNYCWRPMRKNSTICHFLVFFWLWQFFEPWKTLTIKVAKKAMVVYWLEWSTVRIREATTRYIPHSTYLE